MLPPHERSQLLDPTLLLLLLLLLVLLHLLPHEVVVVDWMTTWTILKHATTTSTIFRGVPIPAGRSIALPLFLANLVQPLLLAVLSAVRLVTVRRELKVISSKRASESTLYGGSLRLGL
jgi:hypothetical protein